MSDEVIRPKIAIEECSRHLIQSSTSEVMKMHELVAIIMLWLSANYDLPRTTAQPEIVTLPRHELTDLRVEIAYEKLRAAGLSHAMAELGASAPEVVAFYSDERRTLYLSDEWNGDGLVRSSVIVHELVHHMQNLAGHDHSCPAARERLAYAAQDAWLRQFRSSLAEAFGIDPMTRLVLTACLE